MAIFEFKGINNNMQAVTGKIEANDRKPAIEMLKTIKTLIDNYGTKLIPTQEEKLKKLTQTKRQIESDLNYYSSELQDIIQECQQQINEKEIQLRTSKTRRMIEKLNEQKIIVNIQIGGIETLQNTIYKIVKDEVDSINFKNAMAIMGIGLLSKENEKILKEKKKESKHEERRIKKEQKQLKKDTKSIKKEYKKTIKQIEELIDYSFDKLIFDSNLCDWKQNTSTFDRILFEKERIVRQDGLEKAIDGLTTFEEVVHVFHELYQKDYEEKQTGYQYQKKLVCAAVKK